MADKRISQLVERTDIANNDVVPIVAFGASTTNKATISSIQSYMQENLDVGVTSIGLSMPSAFVVSNSPVTMSGNISVTGAGTVSQYIRGDGSLADFPQGGGGGGASVNYYLNGSVSQGTIGGIAYREMSKSPILGTGTDFVAIADGYLASFITDAGDPALLEIPAGNWNFETYFSASSGGGTPSFYIELYKVDSGGTATLIASNSATPELIAFGTTITPYFSTLAVPITTLTLTDRLALRYYVARSGRTITLHTENSHLCQIITTFTTGLTALNGLTAQVQNFTTGTSGTNFAISSTGNTHTFNLPDASATARGVVTTGIQTIAGIKNFTSTIRSAVSVEMAATGTALPTELKNINGPGLSSSGSNGIGFNSSNNLYFAGSDKGCAVISMTNTGTRTYTLQDASGTLAFTSQIPANIVTGTGGQGRIAYWDSTGVIKSDPVFQYNDFSKRVGIGRTPLVSLDVEGAGAFSGALTLGGALNGTSASFSGNGLFGGASSLTGGISGIATNGATFSGMQFKLGDVSKGFIYASNSQITIDGVSGMGFQVYTNASYTTPALSIATTSAATFSSSVTANELFIANSSILANYVGLEHRYLGTLYGFSKASANDGELRHYIGPSVGWGGRITFYTDTTEKMRITSTGNVGIGTTSPAAKLEIKQSGSEIPMIIDSSSDAFGAYTQYQVNNSGGWETGMARAADGYAYLFSYGSFGTSTSKFTLTNTGNATFTGSVSASGLLSTNDRLYMPGNQPIANWFSSSLSAGYSSSNGYGWVNGAGNLVLGTNGVGRIFMTSSGAVGIGTDNPSDILTVAGNINLPNGVNRQITIGSQTNYNYRLGTDGDDFRILEASTTERLRYSYLNTRWNITGGLAVSGSLSKGSGSFKIDHPLPEKKDTHHLVHSFIEGPQADNIYRGKIELVNGLSEVNIDEASGMSEGTFVLLNGNIQCFTSNESGWTPVKGKVEGNILKIQAQDSKCKDIISWLVIGERIDQHMIDTDWTDQNGKVIVEPLKEQEKPSDILNKDLQNQNQTQDESNA